MSDIQLGLSDQETIDMANAAKKFLNRNNANTASRIIVTDANGKLVASGASSSNVPTQSVNPDSSPVFSNATIGGKDINVKIGLLDSNLGQPVNPNSDVDFNSINNVFVSLNGGANDVYIRNGLTASAARGLMIDESKNLSDKADKAMVAKKPSLLLADLKTNYMTNEVDTSEEIASAINATNLKINNLINMLNASL